MEISTHGLLRLKQSGSVNRLTKWRVAMRNNTKLLVSLDGQTAVWIHPLDLKTGIYCKYDSCLDASNLNDQEFEALVTRLQRQNTFKELGT